MKLYRVHHYPLPAYGLISAIIATNNGEMAGHIFDDYTGRYPLPDSWNGDIKSIEIGSVTNQEYVIEHGVEAINRESGAVEGYVLGLNTRPAPFHTVPRSPGRSAPDGNRILKDNLKDYAGRGRKTRFKDFWVSVVDYVNDVKAEILVEPSVSEFQPAVIHELFDRKDYVWVELAEETDHGFKIRLDTIDDWREEVPFKTYEGQLFYAWLYFNNIPKPEASAIVDMLNKAVKLANE